MPARAPGLVSLPDELLGHCLCFLAPQDGNAVTLVCKRFCRLFYKQPGPWRSFKVAPPSRIGSSAELAQHLEAKQALLQRVAPLVREFAVCRPYLQLHPWFLDGSSGQRPLADFLQLLPHSLAALSLLPYVHPLPRETVQLLQPLTALHSLCLAQLSSAEGLPTVLQRLPRLEQLECGLEEWSYAGSVLLPGLICEFCSLRQMECEGERLWGLSVDAGRWQLVIPLISLAALLNAALPPSASLQALLLEGLVIGIEALQGCTQLPALQWLELACCKFDAAAAAALCALSPQLTTIHLGYGRREQLQSICSQQLPQLRSLRLTCVGQTWLVVDGLPPEVSQLTSLQRLDLSTCRWRPKRVSAMTASAASATSLGDLPDELLGRCLGLLPLREGRSITLVCKRFQRLFFEQPSIWRRFEVTGSGSQRADESLVARLDAKHTLLQRPLTALRSLRIGKLWMPAELPATVQCMPQLQHLECGCCPDGLLDAACQLSGLTALQFAFEREQLPLQQLTQLSQLRCLIVTSYRRDSVQPPAPAAFPLLEIYELRAPDGGMQLAGESLRYCAIAPIKRGAEGPIGLSLEARQLHSFASLLAAAVPPAVTLQALSLSKAGFDAAALQGCTQLAAAQCLELNQCPLDAEALEALFACTPQLDTLHASCADPEHARVLCRELPARVHTLHLSGGLQSPLPELFQLRSLECLDLGADWKLTVAEADMEDLASLPHLCALWLNDQAMSSLPKHMPARPATLDSLPDELLGLCLGLLPRNEGRSITLVNKRFWRLFFEQPRLWRHLELSEFEFRSDEGQVELAGVFCRTCSLGPAKFDGNALACLTLNGLDSSQPLVAVLDAVVPPSVQLQALSLLDSRFSAAVVQGCTQLAALQGLQLRDCPVDAAAGAALLASTPRVTALHLDSCSQIDVGALLRSGLPQLQMLRLAYYLHPLPPELARLTNLCKLVWLTHGTSPQASDVEVLRGLPRLHTLAVNLLSIRERTRVKKGLEASLPGVRIVQA
ncbi:S-phase kinase-associated 2 [Chlorella sorokiniana]|uniref:S-phase kinase-associated 2 n=1 Tax=Chlorella sorokiniana TaxID=3076 RepID=A0A2P6TP68_CHLSO|nr:S-phase kinase-associated 2 [Chlorella sorokiniana]|eukprot:PRW51127.1 S-phase kinase-associated 2 [Chlorella sorokiniana]